MIAEPTNTGSMQDAAIDALDPVIALLALVQSTGDVSLLRKYGPALEGTQHQVKEAFVAFDTPLEPSAASLEVAREVRDLLRAAVRSGRPPVLATLDKPLFREMARLALGLEMPEMSIDVAYQHGGFTTDTRVRKPKRLPPADFKVLVVGAGMMGINAAVKLQQAAREHLSGRGGRYAEPRLLLLLRAQRVLDEILSGRSGIPRLPGAGDGPVQAARAHHLQHHGRGRAVGRGAQALEGERPPGRQQGRLRRPGADHGRGSQ